jgi:predicted nucleotidyltransferase
LLLAKAAAAVKIPTVAELKVIIAPILKRYGVRKAGIFGSFARGEARADSDLDLLVEPARDGPLYKIIDLKIEIEEALSRKVDVVTYSSADKHIKERIMAEEIRIL